MLEGEGVGWLKLNRVKKLMEDENYRNLVISRLNKTMERKVGPDDHIEDVCVPKSVWKGMLKLLGGVIFGLEQSFLHNGSGGMASTSNILEMAHTHYWAKDVNDDLAMKGDASAATTASVSQATSPFGSGENLKLSGEGDQPVSRKPSDASGSSTLEGLAKSDVVQHVINAKKNNLLSRLTSIESNDVSETNTEVNTEAPSGSLSDTGSMTINPAYFNVATRLSQQLVRSTYSDSELDAGLVS